jgi:hypothetical protein
MPNKLSQGHKKRVSYSIELLKKNPDGLKFNVLHKKLCKELKLTQGQASGFIHKIFMLSNEEIIKPARGLYKLANNEQGNDLSQNSSNVEEKKFYSSFANWLIEDVKECSKAIALGGNKFGGRWGTPDVIGILSSSQADIIKGIELTSAEIKTDMKQLITAFGQACSYKLFSHRVYLVIPKQSPQAEITRLDSLCGLFGIGFVLFDKTNKDKPDYQIRSRSQKASPDNSYANKNLKKITKDLGV